MSKRLARIRNKKKRIEEKMEVLQAQYKEVCEEEEMVENEEIVTVCRRNDITLEELIAKINESKQEKIKEKKEIKNVEENQYEA